MDAPLVVIVTEPPAQKEGAEGFSVIVGKGFIVTVIRVRLVLLHPVVVFLDSA